MALQDEYDGLIVDAFRAQPAELSPIQALRGAIRQVFAELPADEAALLRERHDLVRSVPELRTRMLDEFTRNVQLLAEIVAERVGRRADDLAVRTFAGALVEAAMGAMLTWAEGPAEDYLALLDGALAELEAGLPL